MDSNLEESDSKTTIGSLKQEVKTFCEERDWNQFHTPVHLAIGMSTESAELLELFRFKNDEEVKQLLITKRTEIGEELSDVLFFILRFAEMNNFDLTQCLCDKISKNNKKYPVDKAKGKNLKYNEL